MAPPDRTATIPAKASAEEIERRKRAASRQRRAVIHKTRLKRVEEDLGAVRGAEAVSLVCALTREGWLLAGLEEPQYTRAQIPFRFVRGRLT